MKKILSKINKERFFNILLIIIVVLLYVATAMFIYNNFRERKRAELSNKLLDKVDKEINNNNQTGEAEVTYNGMIYTIIGRIDIERSNIHLPILKENTAGAYNTSVVKMSGPDLNTPGNAAIGGHNFMRQRFFIRINKLVKNDVVKITDLYGNTLNYYVYEYGITSPDDASYLAQPGDDTTIEVTLVTCTDSGDERYYVKAKAK